MHYLSTHSYSCQFPVRLTLHRSSISLAAVGEQGEGLVGFGSRIDSAVGLAIIMQPGMPMLLWTLVALPHGEQASPLHVCVEYSITARYFAAKVPVFDVSFLFLEL